MTILHEFSGHWMVHSMGWTLLHFCWQGALVAVMLWSVLRLPGRQSSQIRYGVACGALGLMVVLPVATFVHIGLADYRNALAMRNFPPETGPVLVVQVGVGNATAPLGVRVAAALDHSLPWVLVAWLAGAVVFLVRLNVGYLVARRIKSLAVKPAPADLQELLCELGRRLGILRPVKLLNSALVQVPTVIGWLRPVVLIPLSCFTGLSDVQIKAILCHELAHIRRHDYLVSVFQSVVEALLFYHPAVWWVSKQVRRERECCCDDVAVAVGGDVLAYARALKTLEERRSFYPEAVLGVNGGVLTMRIKRLLGYTDSSAASQLASIALLAIIVLSAGTALGKLAYGQGSAANSAPSVANPAQAVPKPDATQRPVGNAGQDFTDEGQGSLPVDERQAKLDQERRMQELSAETKEMHERLAQVDKMGPEMQEQLENAKRLQGDLGKQTAEARKWSAENQKQLEEAKRQVQEALARLNSPAFRKQLEAARAAATKVNTPEFRKQLEDARAAAAKVNTPEFRKQIEEALKAAGNARESRQQVEARLNSPEFKKQMADAIAAATNINTPEFRMKLEDAKKAAERVNSPEFRRQLNQLLAQNAKIAQESGAPPLPQSGRDGPIRVSAGVMAGNRMSSVVPVYPAEAKAARVQGTVVLHAIISKTGAVENLQVISGPELLRGSAIDAVKNWIYKPYLLNGQPVEVETTINVNYTFGDDGAAAPQEENSAEPATTASGGPMRVSPGVLAGNIISRVNPVYPPEAKAAHIQGVVLLHAIISKTGSVENLQIVSGPKELLTSALDAVKQWTYKPYLLNGEPVEVETTITVNYSLEGSAKVPGEHGEVFDAVAAPKLADGASAPVVIHTAEPEYTKAARKAKTSGVVLVNLIVDEHGSPRGVRVLRGVGNGLDTKAVEAVKQYRFKPAIKDGVAVAEKLNIEVNFQIF